MIGNPSTAAAGFDSQRTVAPAASENPYGVVAANRAVQAVLEDLAALCAESVRATPTVQ